MHRPALHALLDIVGGWAVLLQDADMHDALYEYACTLTNLLCPTSPLVPRCHRWTALLQNADMRDALHDLRHDLMLDLLLAEAPDDDEDDGPSTFRVLAR
jgi:hypothetical protein